MDLCNLCLWNNAYTTFHDDDYSYPTKNSKIYIYYKQTGYNYIVNVNGYNSMNVCNTCLLCKFYNCDIELKHDLITELKQLFISKACIKIQKWWINIIYNINLKAGRKFLFRIISKETKKNLSFYNYI